MKSNRNRLGALVVVAVILVTQTQAAEIKGTVRSVNGGTVTVALQGDSIPGAGDKAEIFFKLVGTDDDVSVATGSVLKVDPDSVELKIENATGDVAKDQLVRITSDKPQKRAATQPAASVATSQGRDPSFAFVDLDKVYINHPKTKEYTLRVNAARSAAREEYDRRAAAKTDDLEQWTVQKQKELAELETRERDVIVSEISATAKRMAGDSASLVVDISGRSHNAVPAFFVTPAAGDITDRTSAALKGEEAATATLPPLRGLKMAFVDFDRIVRHLTKTIEAERQVSASKQAAKQDYDERAAGYMKEFKKVESLSGQARERQRAKVQRLRDEIEAWRVAKENEIGADALKKRDAIVAQMTEKIRTIVVTDDRVIVLDVGGNSTGGLPFILYHREIPDFSDEIVTELNGSSTSAKIPGGGSAPRAALASTTQLRFASIDLDRSLQAIPATQVEQRQRAVADKIVPAIRSLAERDGYNLILDRQAQSTHQVSFIIATRDIPDLTDALIPLLK